MIDNTDAADQADLADISDYKNRFANFMDQAAGDDSINARDIQALKAQDLQVIDGNCAHSIQLGSTTAADVASARSTYLSECAPKFWPDNGWLRDSQERTNG
jgi:hypothetical protein